MNNKKFRKVLSMILTFITILVSTEITTLASPTVNGNETQSQSLSSVKNKSEIINVNGEVQVLNTINNSDKTTVEIIGNANNTFSTITDKSIFVDGSKIATMSIDPVVEPMGTLGTIYSATPGYGTPSDYTHYNGTYNGSVYLNAVIMTLSVATLGIALSVALPAYSVRIGLATTAISVAMISKQSTAMFFHQVTYGHKSMPTLYKEYIQKWYFDSAHTIYIETTKHYSYFS